MGTKVKGLLKGLRYISQVFDENKEKEIDMQIGFPTDVQHVGHIGWDGQTVDNPSWMNEFKSPGAFQSAPLVPSPGEKENPDIKWVSEDSSIRRSRNANSSPTKEKPEKPRTSRRSHSTTENDSNEDSIHKEHGTKSRSSRRQHHKNSSDGHKSSESSGKNHLHIPKISRRKKSKEDGGSTQRSKGTTESGLGQESECGGISKEKQED